MPDGLTGSDLGWGSAVPASGFGANSDGAVALAGAQMGYEMVQSWCCYLSKVLDVT